MADFVLPVTPSSATFTDSYSITPGLRLLVLKPKPTNQNAHQKVSTQQQKQENEHLPTYKCTMTTKTLDKLWLPIFSKGPHPSQQFHSKSPKLPQTCIPCTIGLECSITMKKNPKFPSILKSHQKSSLRPFLHRALQFNSCMQKIPHYPPPPHNFSIGPAPRRR